MSAVVQSYGTWERFSTLEPPPVGFHYELHDGEVVLVPPAKPAAFYDSVAHCGSIEPGIRT